VLGVKGEESVRDRGPRSRAARRTGRQPGVWWAQAWSVGIGWSP
jgi:hypothetical protein